MLSGKDRGGGKRPARGLSRLQIWRMACRLTVGLFVLVMLSRWLAGVRSQTDAGQWVTQGPAPRPAPHAPELPPPPGRDLSRPIGRQLAQAAKDAPPEAREDGEGLPPPRPGPVAQPLAPPGAAVAPNPAPPGLDGLHHGALATPFLPKPQIAADHRRFVHQGEEPKSVLEIHVGRLQLLNLDVSPKRIQIGDESVANYALLSPTELSVQGLKIGATQLNIWLSDPQDPKRSRLLSFLVRVLPDADAKERLVRAYKNLEQEINCVFPDSKVCLVVVGDKLAVTGQAKDIAEANQIMRLVQANVLPETYDVPDLNRPAAADPPAYQLNRLVPNYNRQVLNMLRVPGEQQVLLQVQVAEVDRAAARSVGLNFGITRNVGAFVNASTIGNLVGNGATGGFASFGSGLGNAGGTAGLSGLGAIANLPTALDNGQIQLAVACLRNLAYARFLAEPNMVAINGQTASFQVGGLFPVPVVTGFTASGLQGVNFIPTGVQLTFTPLITDRDRVRLSLTAEVSERDQNAAPTVIDGAAIPSLVTRNFQTTVELREGQTLAVAGLVQTQLDTTGARIPFLGAVPGVGHLFGYDRTNNREQELVVLVTPRLVHPMEHKDLPPLPGHDLFEPNDLEFYLLNRLESHEGRDFRSPIRTDASRYRQYRQMEEACLFGPCGPTVEGPPPLEGVPPGAEGTGGHPPIGPGVPGPGQPHQVPLPLPPGLPATLPTASVRPDVQPAGHWQQMPR